MDDFRMYFDTLARYETLDLYFVLTDLIDFPQTEAESFEGAYYDAVGRAEIKKIVVDTDKQVLVNGRNEGHVGKWIGKQKRNKRKFVKAYQRNAWTIPETINEETGERSYNPDSPHFFKPDGSINWGGYLQGFWGLLPGLWGYFLPSFILLGIFAIVFMFIAGAAQYGLPSSGYPVDYGNGDELGEPLSALKTVGPAFKSAIKTMLSGGTP